MIVIELGARGESKVAEECSLNLQFFKKSQVIVAKSKHVQSSRFVKQVKSQLKHALHASRFALSVSTIT